LTGLASVAVLPVAIYATRFSDAYKLVHAGFAIPLGLVLGVVALRLARRESHRRELTLTPPGRSDAVVVARVLGYLGVCMALAGLVALGVFALLEYAGTRD
jgi:hypothetical protein